MCMWPKVREPKDRKQVLACSEISFSLLFALKKKFLCVILGLLENSVIIWVKITFRDPPCLQINPIYSLYDSYVSMIENHEFKTIKNQPFFS